MVESVSTIRTVEDEGDDPRGDVFSCLDPYHESNCMATPPDGTIPSDSGDDPVKARRARVAAATLLANRIGYLVLALAVSLFFIAFALGFSAPMATAIVVCLVVSFALLAPSIVLGYAVKAADRADAEQSW
jgi:hypothetical protein